MEELIQDELKFYSNLTKPFILNLPNWKDRALAASWVKKIRDESAGTESLRVVYIKLLLFALQRRRLVGIFADDPSRYDELEPIPEGFDLTDIARNLLEVEFAERQDKIRQQLRGQTEIFPPYLTDCSSDFREYVAVQNIPGFGIHSYYAISKEPVNTWNKSERGVFPKLARSAIDTTPLLERSTLASEGPPDTECLCVEDPANVDRECKCKKHATLPPEPKKKSTNKFGKSPPIHPLGIMPPAEDRTPPTWGSSLSQVKNIPKDVESDDDLRQIGAEGFALTDALAGVEQFVDEFHKGEIDKVSKIKVTHVVVPTQAKGKKEVQLEHAAENEDEGEDEEKEKDLNVSRFEEEINADAYLLNYYRDLLGEAAVRRAIALASENIITSSPARTGIPLSTPISSPSPKRLKSPEMLYQEELIAGTQGVPDIPIITLQPASPGGAKKAEEIEEVSPTDDDFTKWNKRLKAVQKMCEKNLTQLDASQQVDKNVVLSKKRVPKQDRACGPGLCGYPCE